jgi:thiamine biosynthesis protein ThiS
VTVTINGEKRTLPDGATVASLLAELGLSALPAAVEVNKRLVPKRRHTEQPLADGDIVEVVTLVGGG